MRLRANVKFRLKKTIGYVFEHVWSEIIKIHTTSKFEGDPVVETISTMSSTLNIPDLICPARVFPAFAFTQWTGSWIWKVKSSLSMKTARICEDKYTKFETIKQFKKQHLKCVI